MTLYLVTDDWHNDGWGDERESGLDVIGVFNSRWAALETIRSLYFKDVRVEEETQGEINVYNYNENESGAEWVYDSGGGSHCINHYIEIREVKLNEVLIDNLVRA